MRIDEEPLEAVVFITCVTAGAVVGFSLTGDAAIGAGVGAAIGFALSRGLRRWHHAG